MTPSEALRRMEARLIPIRTAAGNREAWEDYRAQWLSNDDARVHQGFEAGYDAAMRRVTKAVSNTQTEVLRSEGS
jgi:hypothetical protein